VAATVKSKRDTVDSVAEDIDKKLSQETFLKLLFFTWTDISLYLFIEEKGLEPAIGITDDFIFQLVKILFKYRFLE